uniref:60S acidic ribosomal protein P3 n=1 Tax=Lotus japonicus TaxID=34305 RepID=I3RZH7_LOTJA|nr:unknown [Lotus japonicus]
MGVFTFVLRNSGGDWFAKQHSGGIEASADSTFALQRKLIQAALAVDSSGGVQSSYSPVSPTSAVFQVIVGGAAVVARVGGAAAAGGAAPAEAAPAAEKKKEEKVEESDEEDYGGLSLFDDE